MAHDAKTDDPTVRSYAHDLSKVVIVDQKTEQELFRRYKEHGDIHSRNKLIESGLRFVVKVAQKYSQDLEHQKLLISAGNEGLLVAIDRFDPTRGTRFLSYATWWVILHIREELHRAAVISVPIWRKKSAKKVRDAQEIFQDRLGRPATDKELQKRTGLSIAQIRGVENDACSVVPLEPGGDADQPSEERLEQATINRAGDRLVQYLIMHLPIRERFILQAYFGFITDPPMSLKQIANILSISSERVRQIKIEALDSLKKMLEAFNINSADDVYDS